MGTTVQLTNSHEGDLGGSESLGQRIRRMRLERGWKLSELAKLTGIATSTLSKVENERLNLSYGRLIQVAHGFDLSLAEFLTDGERNTSTRGVASGRLCVERAGEGRALESRSSRYGYLCTNIRQKSMTPLTVEVKARTLEEFGPLLHHDGEKFIIVIAGTIQLHTEFYGPETMETGDSAYFDAAMRHAYTRVGDKEAIVLCLMTGEADIPSA